MRLLVTGRGYFAEQLAHLKRQGFEVLHREAIEASELEALLPSVEGYVLGGDERLDADRLTIARRLSVISYAGSDPSAFIDCAAAERQGIAITRTSAVIASVVAEHAIGLLLATFRGQFAQNEAVKRNGAWQMPSELRASTVGVLGAGAIGGRIAATLVNGFGCHVLYASRSAKPELEAALGAIRVDREMLFTRSDAVIIAASATAGVLVAARELSLVKPGFVLVNVANARLVDVAALKSALDARRVVAAFDGYWTEPVPTLDNDPHGLLGYPDAQFVVTPHSAAKVRGAWDAMLSEAIDNLVRTLDAGDRFEDGSHDDIVASTEPADVLSKRDND